MIQRKLRVEPEILADGLDDVPTRPESVVWESWARPGNDAVDRSDHHKVITPNRNGWELAISCSEDEGVW
jgi:hypothetical protein